MHALEEKELSGCTKASEVELKRLLSLTTGLCRDNRVLSFMVVTAVMETLVSFYLFPPLST